MPSFGYTTEGGTPISANNLCFANIRSSEIYTASSGDTVTEIFFYGNSPGSVDIHAAPYTMSSGNPLTRVGSGHTITVGSTLAWYSTGTISEALSAGVTYTIGFESTGITMRYDSFSGNNRSRHNAATLPVTWVPTTNSGVVFSVYANYTTGGSTKPTIDGVSTYTSIDGVSTFTSFNGVT